MGKVLDSAGRRNGHCSQERGSQLSCIGRGEDAVGGTYEMTGQTMYKLKDRHKSKGQMKR